MAARRNTLLIIDSQRTLALILILTLIPTAQPAPARAKPQANTNGATGAPISSLTYDTANDRINGSNAMPLSTTLARPGNLDTSFDKDGKVLTRIGINDDYAQDVAIQADGKIIAAGYADTGEIDFALARYNTDGGLDTSFGSGGTITTDVGGHHDYAYAIALRTNGKIVVVGTANDAIGYSDSDFALAQYNVDGSLDTSFGADGLVTTDIAGFYDQAYAVALQSDGKIVVAGEAHTGSTNDFAVARYNADGSLDTSFGTDGLVTTGIYGAYDCAYSVAIQANGKIVAAGFIITSVASYAALVRYNTDGSLDISFGSGGIVTSDFGSDDEIYAIALQTDGKIVATGSNFAVARYNADGSLDTSFGTDGLVTTGNRAYSIAIQADGKIVTTGYAALARYNSDGSLDTSFGTDGFVTTGTYRAYSAAIQADGRIVAAGYADKDFALARYNTNGSIDTTGFGAPKGYVTTEFGMGHSEARSIAIQTDGRIVATGCADGQDGRVFALARYNTDGSLDASFGSGGIITTTFWDSASLSAVALQADGKIVAFGDAGYDTYPLSTCVLARYNSDGSLDTAFNSDGLVLAPGNDLCSDVVIQADGKIITAGEETDYYSHHSDFALARYNSDGSLDSTFGTDGLVITDFENSDTFHAIALQADGRIVAAGTIYTSDHNFALARYNADGSLDSTFGIDGLVVTDDGTCYDAAIQADGKIIAAGTMLARYNGDGSLDTLFGSEGIAAVSSQVHAIALQADGKIIAAARTYNRSTRDYDISVARYNTDGSLDASFGTGGIATTDFGAHEQANAVAIQTDEKIVVAGMGLSNFVLARYHASSLTFLPLVCHQ